jgi:hypothetical protein
MASACIARRESGRLTSWRARRAGAGIHRRQHERRISGIRSGVTTHTYQALAQYVESRQIDVLIADNSKDVFDGEEINRAMVRGFIRSLEHLIRLRDGAVLLREEDRK